MAEIEVTSLAEASNSRRKMMLGMLVPTSQGGNNII